LSGPRWIDDNKRKKMPRAFGGILRHSTIEVLAHLGEHAFDDPAAAGSFVAAFVIATAAPSGDHRLTAFRLVGPKSPKEKNALLLGAIESLNREERCPERVAAAAN
jgi:hypothetical protein